MVNLIIMTMIIPTRVLRKSMVLMIACRNEHCAVDGSIFIVLGLTQIAGESHSHRSERGCECGRGLVEFRAASLPSNLCAKVLAGLRLHQAHPGIQACRCCVVNLQFFTVSLNRCCGALCLRKAFGLGALGNLATAEALLNLHPAKSERDSCIVPAKWNL